MKRIPIIIILLSVCWIISIAQPAEIWVATDGSDHNQGTKDSPLASLTMALRKAREMRRLNDPFIKNGVEIILEKGVYRLYEPVYIRPEDSGSKDSPTIIRAAEEKQAILSGGVVIGNWERVTGKVEGLPKTAKHNVWSAKIPEIWGNQVNFRQLWVNGKKADRAASFSDGGLDRILKSDSLNEEIWIPLPKVPLQNAVQLEFMIIQWWTLASLRVKQYDVIGDKVRLRFYQPESRVEFEHPWPMPIDDSTDIYMADTRYRFCGNSPFFFANAIELLNQPGEWCRDPRTGKIYYWPRTGEDMHHADVVIPILETLIRIEGSPDNPVRNIVFQGVDLEHTTWMRPSEAGHIPVQDGMYFYDAYKLKIPGTPGNKSLENQGWLGRQPAGIALKCAENIRFDRCSFRHMSATGLDLISGTNHNTIEGCIFRDIGGSGIRAGFYGDLSTEDHIPYDPKDFREVCHHETIANNLITDCSNEYWGCDGIDVGFAHDIDIEHNEVSYLNNSGISVGWGWTEVINCMKNNRIHANNIHHFAGQLYDVAGIYILSAQPNTEISNNSIHHIEKAPYAHLKEHYHYIYLDQNSSYIRVINNWTQEAKFNANAVGPGNEWKNNGPQVSETVKSGAGLEPGFRNLLEEIENK